LFEKYYKGPLKKEMIKILKELNIELIYKECCYCDGSGQIEPEVECVDEDGDVYYETEYETCDYCSCVETDDIDYYDVINADNLDPDFLKYQILL